MTSSERIDSLARPFVRAVSPPLDPAVFPFKPHFSKSSRAAMDRATGGGKGRSMVDRNEAWERNRENRLADDRRRAEAAARRMSNLAGAKPTLGGAPEPPRWASVASDFFERQKAFLQRKDETVERERERLWTEARRATRKRWDPERRETVEVDAPTGTWDAETREEFFARQAEATQRLEASRGAAAPRT